MTLLTSYESVKGTLRPQVQGDCGIFSFYNAVCILRQEDARHPAVPPPRKRFRGKSDATGPSLRNHAKKLLDSGQGEILSKDEMVGLLTAHGYGAASVGPHGDVSESRRTDFIDRALGAGHPVLVPYLADDDPNGKVGPVVTVAPSAGAHWSVLIARTGPDEVKAVEPNDPATLRTWSLKTVLASNAMTDRVKFPQYWEKVRLPNSTKVHYIEPVTDPTDLAIRRKAGKRIYDLDPKGVGRQDAMNLSNLLIAIVPRRTA